MEDEGVALACESGGRVLMNRGVGGEETGSREEEKKKEEKMRNGEERHHFCRAEEALQCVELQ